MLDTNIIVRYLMGDDAAKAAKAVLLMKKVEKQDALVIIPDEVLSEVVWILKSYYKVSRTEIAQRLAGIIAFSNVEVSSKDFALQSLSMFATSTADIVDCMLAARSRISNIPIYSFDKKDLPRLGAAWEKP